MTSRRAALILVMLAPTVGCAAMEDTVDDAVADAVGADAPLVVAAVPNRPVATTIPVITLPPELTDVPPGSAPTITPPATATPTTATPTTATPTTAPAEPVPDAPGTDPVVNDACTVTVAEGDTLRSIAARFDDETIDLTSIVAENALTSTDVAPGTVLDVCPGNGLDDVAGTERVDPTAVVQTGVEAQQEHLNLLFDGLGIEPLLVDGISGPVTRQRLCAARLVLGLPTSTADMLPGSEEEAVLFAARTLPIPYTSAIVSPRWILIDRTCQMMFVGRGTEAVDLVFATSTGQAEFPTRLQDRSPAFRYNPVLHNNGWHNSTTYPVAADNPLNGNMYKPLYFDGGQAIHGANNVPRSPASHGCARLRVADQDLLVAWLGLADADGPTNDVARIAVTVNVQGDWRG
jgi:hypothetical protein